MTAPRNDERTQRYSDALLGAWVPQEYVRRVTAVADAEQARDRQLLDEATARAEVAEAQVARVEAVRQRVLDPTAHATEGPLIARIKVDSWLRAALATDPLITGGRDDASIGIHRASQ